MAVRNLELMETYDRIALQWHADHESDDWWVEGTDEFIRLVPPCSWILDAGCGSGVKSKYLADHGYLVTGIDISHEMLAIARKKVPRAEFLLLDMRDVENIPDQFTGILSQASLLHIPRKEALSVVKMFARKLWHGGLLYVAVKGVRPDGPLEELKEESDYGFPYTRFFSYYTLEDIKGYFIETGFAIRYEKTVVSGNTEWIQVIGQKK